MYLRRVDGETNLVAGIDHRPPVNAEIDVRLSHLDYQLGLRACGLDDEDLARYAAILAERQVLGADPVGHRLPVGARTLRERPADPARLDVRGAARAPHR